MGEFGRKIAGWFQRREYNIHSKARSYPLYNGCASAPREGEALSAVLHYDAARFRTQKKVIRNGIAETTDYYLDDKQLMHLKKATDGITENID